METGHVIRFYGAAFAGAYWGVKYGIMGESINTKAAASDNKAKSLKTMEDYAENSVDYEDALATQALESGNKIDYNNLMRIEKFSARRIIWLEQGSLGKHPVGWLQVLEHESDFEKN